MFDFRDRQEEIDLVNRIEYHADEVTAEDQSIGLDPERVYEQAAEAAQGLIRKAPRRLVKELAVDGSDSDAKNVDSYTRIVVPTDHHRFLNLQLETWARPVFGLHPPHSNRVALQYTEETRTNVETPVAARLANASEGSSQVIYGWPQDETAGLRLFSYVPHTRPEALPAGLKDVVAWTGASRILQSQKEEGAGAAADRASGLLSNIRTGEHVPTSNEQ